MSPVLPSPLKFGPKILHRPNILRLLRSRSLLSSVSHFYSFAFFLVGSPQASSPHKKFGEHFLSSTAIVVTSERRPRLAAFSLISFALHFSFSSFRFFRHRFQYCLTSNSESTCFGRGLIG